MDGWKKFCSSISNEVKNSFEIDLFRGLPSELDVEWKGQDALQGSLRC